MRILVAGFPHSGTSILRKLIGNHPEVHDHHLSETKIYRRDQRLLRRIFPRSYQGKKHIVFKWPFHDVEETTNAHRIVYIIRDPFDVFGSLGKRFEGGLPENHSLAAWQRYARFFLDKAMSNRHYKIHYEDMFSDDFAVLRGLIDWLGLEWHDHITDTQSRYAPIRYAGPRPEREPARTEHTAFRAWQTSQALNSRAGQSRRYLDPALAQRIAALQECSLLGYELTNEPAGPSTGANC